jgi:SulP family sulfate permease
MKSASARVSKNPLSLLGHAVRQTLRQGYTLADFRADLIAGIVTGIVALPLSMALGIATGVPPEHGLYTAIVAGLIASLTGGAPLQVTGPTAAFVVLLVPITSRYGLGGLCLASAMAGAILLLMALCRLGTLVRYVPHPVTLGFTGGIGVVIATLQLKDFLGLPIGAMPETYIEKVQALVQALPQLSSADAAVGLGTLALLLGLPRVAPKVPPALVALGAAGVASFALHRLVPGFSVITIMDKFSFIEDGIKQAGIPRLPPMPSLSWFGQGLDGQPLVVTQALLVELLPSAIAIALLAAIESLLAAVVADGMSNRRHNSDAELLGVGLANLVTPFFGGFAATGAIARTATNIRAGARSPFASMLHAGFVLASILAMAPVLGFLPMASLAALLLQVAWRMSDAPNMVRALKESPRGDVVVLLICFTLTVVFDMVVSVTVGVLLSALLFSRRMAAAAEAEQQPDAQHSGVLVHKVHGPLFFGDAERVMEPLYELDAGTRAVIVDLADVTLVDASGIASLETAVQAVSRSDVPVYLISPSSQLPQQAIARANLPRHCDRLTASLSQEAALADLEAADESLSPGFDEDLELRLERGLGQPSAAG